VPVEFLKRWVFEKRGTGGGALVDETHTGAAVRFFTAVSDGVAQRWPAELRECSATVQQDELPRGDGGGFEVAAVKESRRASLTIEPSA